MKKTRNTSLFVSLLHVADSFRFIGYYDDVTRMCMVQAKCFDRQIKQSAVIAILQSFASFSQTFFSLFLSLFLFRYFSRICRSFFFAKIQRPFAPWVEIAMRSKIRV